MILSLATLEIVRGCAGLGEFGSISTYDHGVQTSTGESRGANQVLGCGEEGFEIRLRSNGISITLGCTVVEALEDGIRNSERGREGKKTGRTHFRR